MSKQKNRILSLTLSLLLTANLAACAAKPVEEPAPQPDAEQSQPEATPDSAEASPESDSAFPFSLTTYNDMTVTFDKVPETIIAANTNTADQLLAMGLGDKIIYRCYVNSEINPLYQAEYDSIPILAEQAATLEQLLDVSPDFVYGRSSAFSEKNGTTHDTLTGYGIASLSSIEGYKLGADVEDVYEDFYNLGRIFQLEDRAQEIVSGMQETIAQVEETVTGAEPVRVFVFDMETDEGPYTCGNNFTAKLIRHAGGINIFEDMENTWATVGWESVIAADPEVIVINDYGSSSLEEKIAQLKENPALAEISAIKNDRIISVHLCEVFASSMTADTVAKFAEAFHPDLFQ